MRKEFESTFGEAVKTHYRFAELAGVVAKQKWSGLILSPILFLSFFGLTYGVYKGDWMESLVGSGLVTVLYISIYLMIYKTIYRRHLRKFVTKTQGNGTVSCEYEIDETGLTFRKKGQQILFSWGGVKSVNDTNDAVEVIVEPLGVARIPKRIFPEPAELQEWVEYIKSHAGI